MRISALWIIIAVISFALMLAGFSAWQAHHAAPKRVNETPSLLGDGIVRESLRMAMHGAEQSMLNVAIAEDIASQNWIDCQIDMAGSPQQALHSRLQDDARTCETALRSINLQPSARFPTELAYANAAYGHAKRCDANARTTQFILAQLLAKAVTCEISPNAGELAFPVEEGPLPKPPL